MNKSPFLEWLKRIRSEIIDTSTMCGEYSLAYFNSALMGDSQKMEYVLYQIKGDMLVYGKLSYLDLDHILSLTIRTNLTCLLN